MMGVKEFHKKYWAGKENELAEMLADNMERNAAFLKWAVQREPEGIFCYRCMLENTFCDDCGWFYGTIENGTNGPLCKKCVRELGLTYGDR